MVDHAEDGIVGGCINAALRSIPSDSTTNKISLERLAHADQGPSEVNRYGPSPNSFATSRFYSTAFLRDPSGMISAEITRKNQI